MEYTPLNALLIGMKSLILLSFIALIAACNGAPKSTVKTERVALCQYCFWTGELKIGAIEGVMTTEAGFIGGREVTLVTYDPKATTLEKILKQAKADGVATAIYLDDTSKIEGSKKIRSYRPAPAHDQKKQIQGTSFAKLKLTPEQATKVNAFARTDPKKALQYLTAEQRKKLGL